MKLLPLLSLLPLLLQAGTDPALDAYQAWNQEHLTADRKARSQSLFDASADWVAKWPDNRFAWDERRVSLLETRNRSAELWKQVDENLMRLSGPHTFAALAAYDWTVLGINLKEAESLINSEIDWIGSRPAPPLPRDPSFAALVDEAQAHETLFFPLSTLASTQIQLKEFDSARATIARIRAWLDGDFKRYFDQDPLETFPDYGAKYFVSQGELAQAEGRKVDALAFYQQVVTNPYFRREYGGLVGKTQQLWKDLGGSDEAWRAFSTVPPLPAGTPAGHTGISFLPWVALNYKLPPMNPPLAGSRNWTNSEFSGKTTLVYVWAKSCAPCWNQLPAIQALHDAVKDRPDFQVVTLNAEEDSATLAAFLKDKGYTFPTIAGKSYAETLAPDGLASGQIWIVDRTATIRLQRASNILTGATQAFIDEATYKLTQISTR